MPLDDLSATAQVQFNPVGRTDRELGAVPYSVPIIETFRYVLGTGPGQINDFFDDQQSIAPNDVATFQFYGGVMNYQGGVINFTKLKGIWIRNRSLIDPITVRPAAANGLTSFGTQMIIPPDSFDFRASRLNGWAVTAGNHILEILNGPTGPTTIDIVVAGVV